MMVLHLKFQHQVVTEKMVALFIILTQKMKLTILAQFLMEFVI